MKVVKVVFITYIYSCVNSKSIIIYNVAETTFTTFILHLFHGLLVQWVEALLPKSGKVASIGWKGCFYLVETGRYNTNGHSLTRPIRKCHSKLRVHRNLLSGK